MKFLVTKTVVDLCEYDALFLMQGQYVKPVELLFCIHDLNQNNKNIQVPDLPTELKFRIMTCTIIELLRDFNFEMATLLIGINSYMIHRIYYALFGGSSDGYLIKYKRICRVMQITRSIYDNYLMAEKVCSDQTIVLDYDGHWVLSSNHAFYPWDMRPEISVIQVYHSQMQGLHVTLGPFYGDEAILLDGKERRGVIHCEGIAFPFLHILMMDQFRLLSVFLSPKSKYYFARFSMFLKALFGKYTKVYYFTQAVPLSTLQSEDDFDALFDQGYCFEELPNCVRK